MDSPPVASHASTWFCPALSAPPLLTILTVRGGIVVGSIVVGLGDDSSSVATDNMQYSN